MWLRSYLDDLAKASLFSKLRTVTTSWELVAYSVLVFSTIILKSLAHLSSYHWQKTEWHLNSKLPLGSRSGNRFYCTNTHSHTHTWTQKRNTIQAVLSRLVNIAGGEMKSRGQHRETVAVNKGEKNVRKRLAAEKNVTSSMCVFMFFLGEACTGGAQEQGIERSTDSVRNPNWFHVPPPHPPPPSPALRNTPLLSPPVSHISPPLHPHRHTPPYTSTNHHSLRCHPDTAGASNGVGGGKNAKMIKNKRKINVSCPLFPKKRMFSLRFKWEEKKKKIKLTSDSGFCKYFLFLLYTVRYKQQKYWLQCAIFIYKFLLLAYMDVIICSFSCLLFFVHFSLRMFPFLDFSCVITGLGVCCEFAS